MVFGRRTSRGARGPREQTPAARIPAFQPLQAQIVSGVFGWCGSSLALARASVPSQSGSSRWRRCMIRAMASESSARPHCEFEDPARPGGRSSSVGPSDAGEPTLEGAFSADGVDLTVIRWMLQRTPEERLQAAQQLIDAAWALRGDEA